MKTQVISLFSVLVLVISACDTLSTDPLADQSVVLSDSASGGENLRKKIESNRQILEKVERNYKLMENTYALLPTFLPVSAAKEALGRSRTEEAFLESMISRSLEIFDQNIRQNGRFLSPLALRNHGALEGGEHEFEYDLTAFIDDEEAAVDFYIKIPDIDGETKESRPSESISFNFSKIIGNSSTTSAESCPIGKKIGPCDSIPPVKAMELEELVAFLASVDRSNGDPRATAQGLKDLEIRVGIDPIETALLLPAIQKARDAARIDARGKADILVESLSRNYQVDFSEEKGRFMKLGGAGAIGFLIQPNYDDSGDLDWASIQLNRAKFELEMYFLWSRFWDQATSGLSRD